jgi:hypothetical protein
MKDKIILSDLLFAVKPAHWPSSSFYCLRSALRDLAKSVPIDQPFSIVELPGLIDRHLMKEALPTRSVWTLMTYKSRILRLAAEHACGAPLKPWEAKLFFEKLNLNHKNKEVCHENKVVKRVRNY